MFDNYSCCIFGTSYNQFNSSKNALLKIWYWFTGTVIVANSLNSRVTFTYKTLISYKIHSTFDSDASSTTNTAAAPH